MNIILHSVLNKCFAKGLGKFLGKKTNLRENRVVRECSITSTFVAQNGHFVMVLVILQDAYDFKEFLKSMSGRPSISEN